MWGRRTPRGLGGRWACADLLYGVRPRPTRALADGGGLDSQRGMRPVDRPPEPFFEEYLFAYGAANTLDHTRTAHKRRCGNNNWYHKLP